MSGFLRWMAFPLAVVPKAKLFARTHSPGTAEDYAKEFRQKIFRRIHAQFPGRRDNGFSQHFEATQLFQLEGKINFFTSKVLLIESANDIEIATRSEEKCACPKIQAEINRRKAAQQEASPKGNKSIHYHSCAASRVTISQSGNPSTHMRSIDPRVGVNE